MTEPPSQNSNMETTSTPLPSSVKDSPLFKLPRELHDVIYEFSYSADTHASVTKDAGIPEPGLLSTCKVIRNEAIAVFYGETRLNFIIDSDDPAVLLLWDGKKKYLAREYNLVPKAQWSTREGIRTWVNLKRCLQLWHSGTIQTWPNASAPGTPNYSEEKRFTRGLFEAVRAMRDRPWDEVCGVLDMLRLGLEKFHPVWGR
jgi:hypothetical protein